MSSGAPVRSGLTIRGRRGGKGRRKSNDAAARVVSPLFAAAQLGGGGGGGGGGMTAKEYIAQRRGSSAAFSNAAGAGLGATKRVIGGKEVHGVLKETNPLNVVEIVIETTGAGTRLGGSISEREHAHDVENLKVQQVNQSRGGGVVAGGRPPLHNAGPNPIQSNQVSASNSLQDMSTGPLHLSISSSFSTSEDEEKVSFGPRKSSHRGVGANDVAHPPGGSGGGSGSVNITPILTPIVPATPPRLSSELSLQDYSNNGNGGSMDRAARAHFIGGRSPTGTSGNNSFSSTSQLEASVYSGVDGDSADKVYFEPMHVTHHHVAQAYAYQEQQQYYQQQTTEGYAPYNQYEQQQQQQHYDYSSQVVVDSTQSARDRVKSFS
jgi:hypothetical protein